MIFTGSGGLAPEPRDTASNGHDRRHDMPLDVVHECTCPNAKSTYDHGEPAVAVVNASNWPRPKGHLRHLSQRESEDPQ